MQWPHGCSPAGVIFWMVLEIPGSRGPALVIRSLGGDVCLSPQSFSPFSCSLRVPSPVKWMAVFCQMSWCSAQAHGAKWPCTRIWAKINNSLLSLGAFWPQICRSGQYTPSSTGWTSKIKVQAELVSHEASVWLAAATSPCGFTWSFLSVCRGFSVYVLIFSQTHGSDWNPSRFYDFNGISHFKPCLRMQSHFEVLDHTAVVTNLEGYQSVHNTVLSVCPKFLSYPHAKCT